MTAPPVPAPPPLLTRLLAEIIGTFGFFFIGFSGIAASIDQAGAIGLGGVAAGFGLGLAMMIFAFGHISGGHFNPAVSIGLACGRQFPWREVPGYIVAQAVGGDHRRRGRAGRLLRRGGGRAGERAGRQRRPDLRPGVVGAGPFLLVISAVATDARAPWNGVLAPLAIGGFIFVAATVIGPFSGGSFNPARSFAPALLAGTGGDLWLYLLAPAIGGAIGGAVFWVLRRTRAVRPRASRSSTRR